MKSRYFELIKLAPPLAGFTVRLKGNKREFGEIVYLEDGYLYWLPVGRLSGGGVVSAEALQDLVNVINALNESWDTQVQNDPVLNDLVTGEGKMIGEEMKSKYFELKEDDNAFSIKTNQQGLLKTKSDYFGHIVCTSHGHVWEPPVLGYRDGRVPPEVLYDLADVITQLDRTHHKDLSDPGDW